MSDLENKHPKLAHPEEKDMSPEQIMADTTLSADRKLAILRSWADQLGKGDAKAHDEPQPAPQRDELLVRIKKSIAALAGAGGSATED